VPYAKKNKEGTVLNIGMMGRVADIKNYLFAVDIAKKLKEDNIDAKIIIAGGGNKDDLENVKNKISKLGISDKIDFVGIVKNPSVFWKDKDLALITSKNEGTPISLIEAMFSELPFIASKVGGIVDMVGDELSIRDNIYTYDNAVLIDGFNADDFVSGIKYFKDLAKRKEAGQNALKIAQNKYTFEAHQNKLKKIYISL
jgi:glycosyltransferase involved in cell wall biosynthesis